MTPQSQEYFAFEWKDLESSITGKLTGTKLHKGIENLPTLFNESLHHDLTMPCESNLHVTLLQYVDDHLTAEETEENCLRSTKQLMVELRELDY